MEVKLIYLVGILGWFYFWLFHIGWKVVYEIKTLSIPIFLGFIYLFLNLIISGSSSHSMNIELEESLFGFLDSRSGLAISATASVLVVATIIYSVSDKVLPGMFIGFVSYAFICLVGLMAPIVWIPTDSPGMLFVLRHCQTVPFLWGIFLCVSSIVVILDDIFKDRKTFKMNRSIGQNNDLDSSTEPEPDSIN